MQLLWLHYRGSKPRYILLLELGRYQGKICGIESHGLKGGIRQKILDSKSILSALSLGERVAWIKKHCPAAMGFYKAIKETNAKIIDTYPLK